MTATDTDVLDTVSYRLGDAREHGLIFFYQDSFAADRNGNASIANNTASLPSGCYIKPILYFYERWHFTNGLLTYRFLLLPAWRLMTHIE